jgi:hypothetical protein
MRVRIRAVVLAVVLSIPPAAGAFSVGVAGAAGAPAPVGATAAAAVAGPSYIPLSPTRVTDTRAGAQTVDGIGAGTGALGARATRRLPVGGRAGVAADAVAVALNVTADGPTANTFLTVFPADTARPLASNLNVPAGATIANLVIAKVGTAGQLDFYNDVGSVHLVADVVGYFPAGTALSAFAPTRYLDTRPAPFGQTFDGTAQRGGAVGPNGTLNLQITGRGTPAIPATAGSVILNVTATEATSGTFVTVYPTGSTKPLASNLNVRPGVDVPNLVIAKVGTGGSISLFNEKGSTHLVADVVGWLPVDATAFTGVVPARLLDTRPTGTTIDGTHRATGAVAADTSTSLVVTNRGGVPATGVGAVVLNVTASQPTAPTYVTAFPSGEARPLASNLNLLPGTDVPNLVIAKVGADGRVLLYNDKGATHLIADVVGWFPAVDSPVRTWGCPEWDTAACAVTPVRTAPTNVDGFLFANRPTALATGSNHSLAVLADGGVVAWGDNTSGQLGSGTTVATANPTRVTGLGAGSGVAQVAAGRGISVARRADGTVLTWGLASRTPVAVTFPGSTSAATAVFAAENRAGAILADGSLWAWQDNQTAATMVATAGVRSVASGIGHVLILMSDGGVFSFGTNTRGQLGDGTTTSRLDPLTSGFAAVSGLGAGSGVVAVAAGGASSYALRADGSVLAWGDGTRGQLGGGAAVATPVTTPTAVATLAAGSGVTVIAAGDNHAVALRADGSVLAWGDGTRGQLGGGTVVAAPVATPTAVPSLAAGSGVTAIVASGQHTVVLR